MKKRVLIVALVVVAIMLSAIVTPTTAEDDICYVPSEYATIQDAVDLATCSTVIVAAGNHRGAEVTRPVVMWGEEGAKIFDGPFLGSYPFQIGFKLYHGGGSGSRIRGFEFTSDVEFPVFAYRTDNVTVDHNTMYNSLQSITNWGGSAWHIHHNVINNLTVACGGGIGIFIGSYDLTPARDNIVAFNDVFGSVNPDCAMYSTPGIGLMSDARWGAPGGPVQDNKVLHNKVSVQGTWTDPGTGEEYLTGVGIELTDYGLEHGTTPRYLEDNKVMQNDPLGSSEPLALNPPELEDYNVIHNNPGKGVGHGLPPSLFRP